MRRLNLCRYVSILGAVDPRRKRPHSHRLRWERDEQIARVGFLPEPALVSALRQDQRHAVVDLRDELIGRHGNDDKGSNPLSALRLTPVLP